MGSLSRWVGNIKYFFPRGFPTNGPPRHSFRLTYSVRALRRFTDCLWRAWPRRALWVPPTATMFSPAFGLASFSKKIEGPCLKGPGGNQAWRGGGSRKRTHPYASENRMDTTQGVPTVVDIVDLVLIAGECIFGFGFRSLASCCGWTKSISPHF